MTSSPDRRRAPGMSPEQRREMVIRAALPLVAEYGGAVTTQQIARAAGIGEATIFRVFDDKEAVLEACVLAAMDPAHVLSELQSISLDQPLVDRLVEAAEALRAHLDRMGTVIGALWSSGHRRPEARERRGGMLGNGSAREASQAATRAAVAELFEPDRDALRLPAEVLTRVFLGLLFGAARVPGEGGSKLDAAQLVDLFLHGALVPAGERK